MQHVLTASENGKRMTVVTDGDGDPAGIIAFLKDIVAHPAWHPGMDIFIDHRKLALGQITPSGVEAVSHYFKSISPVLGDGRLALLMNRDVDFGIARAWETLTEGDVDMSIRVFRDLDSPETWLAR